MLYKIVVSGCDDSTEVVMELTASEAEVVAKVAALISKTSAYQCQPTMSIETATAKDLTEYEQCTN